MDMAWWILSFTAALAAIIAKWFFTNKISRMRQTLSRQQRETLELKETVQGLRQAHQKAVQQAKSKETDIRRLKKHLDEQENKLKESHCSSQERKPQKK